MMKRPIQLNESVTIDRPAADVWRVVADYDADVEWRHGLREMSASPPGQPAAGTEVHEVLRLAGSTYVTDTTVGPVGPGMEYRFAGRGTSGAVSGGRSVSAKTPDQSAFSYEVTLHLAGWRRWIRPLVARQMRSYLRGDLARLRDQLEASSAMTT